MGDVDGSVALLTGAAGGIGVELARVLAARGARLTLTDRDPDRLATMASAMPAATAVPLDVTDPAACQQVVDQVVEGEGRLDLVVSNAGIGVAGDAHELSLAHWRSSVEVNLMGAVHLVQAAYPTMVRAGRGRIAFVASLSGLVPTPLMAPYTSTKHALVGLGLALRAEAAPHGVSVTTICPGPVDTGLLDQSVPADLAPVARPPDPRRYLTRLAGRPQPAAAFAEAAVDGIERERALVIVPARSRGLALLHRLAPSLVARAGARELARERATMPSLG